MIAELIGVCVMLGVYWVLARDVYGILLLGMASNLCIVACAVPGHALTQSLVLTAVVVGACTVALWVLASQV